MALYVDLNLADSASTLGTFINQITFVEEDLVTPTQCVVGLNSPALRVRVTGAASAIAAAIAAAAGVAVSGEPDAPLVEFTQLGDGAKVWLQYATVAALRQDELAPTTQTFIDTIGAEGPWLVLAARATVLASLVAASAATPSAGAASNRLRAQAVIIAGAISSQVSDFGCTMALTAPYVPGSGIDALTLTNGPTEYILQCTAAQGPTEFVARATGPGLPTFTVIKTNPSRQVAAGLADNAGALSNQYGVAFTANATGDTTYTLDADPGAYHVSPTLLDPTAGMIQAIQTSATVFHILTFNALGVAAALPFSFTVDLLATTPNVPPATPNEGAYLLQVFSRD